MSNNRDADQVVNAFARALYETVAAEGWVLVRLVSGNANRAFEVRKDGQQVGFTAHLSQTNTGFWGLTAEKADELIRHGREHLVLLRGPESGFFVPNPVFQRLYPRFSTEKKTHSIKINESQVRAQARFRDCDELWEMLKERI